MLIINECRTCNADKATCPIRTELQKKLVGIKERLKYKCKEWRQHVLYKVGDKIEFTFLEFSTEYATGYEKSEEVLKGEITYIGKKKPVYQVLIDKENRDKINPERTGYDKFVTTHDFFEEAPTLFEVPVKESFIIGLAE